ncbi:stage II sporulation protein R [Ruminiclostridium cellulolyticum]|uniref:Stage II sporulation protein R n=1 Tax=Ruminiclostridium cellulolyticum (strain ATCC 35319 / DSM 5812 / JCM 6584 / H10) TaxID=394503 RepID=B8I599_RUMCH|nr:stage II sporulation protein R [Ruminiclostridium cellulolyticum]ACL74679.1 stage II sporulation protein R [Ruminiclostridium cellulolyticum H10]
MNKSLSLKPTKILSVCITIAILIVFSLWMLSYTYAEDVNAGLSQNLVRLHVIANSDSASDQALKLKVRDEIIEYMKEKLSDSRNIDQTKEIINQNLLNIENISKEVIKKNSSNYSVKASLGNYSFPTKTYGDIALPAGKYQALRIVIGQGSGANWWCVLFPPLCFIDATHGTIPDSVKQNLKTSLSDEEYKLITTSDEEIPVKIKFKLVEFLEGSKVKLSGVINKMFN